MNFEQDSVENAETNFCFSSENRFQVKIVDKSFGIIPKDVFPAVFNALLLFLLWQFLILPKIIKILK
jgi:hypothetical protein